MIVCWMKIKVFGNGVANTEPYPATAVWHPKYGFGSLTHFGFPRLALPRQKKEAKHKQHSQIFTTQRYEQKHTKLIFPFIYTHKRFSYFFRFTCNTLFICIKQSIMQYKRTRWSIEMQKSGAFSHWLKNPNRFIYLGKSEPEFLSVFIFSLCNFFYVSA